MGTSASCSIVLVPANKPFYWTGETISGNVVLTVARSLKIKSIDVNIIGQLVYTETRSTGKSTQTVTVRKNFYVERIPLVIPPTNGVSYDEVSRSCYSPILTNKTIVSNKATYLLAVFDYDTIIK
jgi:hypothetical protein